MMSRIIALFLFMPVLFAQDAAGLLNEGVQAFKSARYVEAVAAFERVVALDPSNLNGHLYLATAHMAQFIPGADSAENRDHAARAEAGFKRVLELQPRNRVALQSLASLAYNQKQLDDATSWNLKLIEADPNNKEAYYTLGVIAWTKFYPEYSAARKQAGMKPEDPGPLRDFNLRGDLRNRFEEPLRDGMAYLTKALEIDPMYDDAMAYMNLLIRERADLRETTQEYQADIRIADAWVAKALETKRAKGGASSSSSAPPPPPPPGGGNPPQRIRIGGNVQAANLLQKADPVYPPLAMQARVQGTVRYQVIIGKDGHLLNIQLISGHPLLVPAATDAIKQYVYKPTLLNGQPVEVITQVDISFALSQ